MQELRKHPLSQRPSSLILEDARDASMTRALRQAQCSTNANSPFSAISCVVFGSFQTFRLGDCAGEGTSAAILCVAKR